MKKIGIALLIWSFYSLIFNAVFGQVPSIAWAKCYGGSEMDEANCIQQTFDGGYIVAGYTSSNDGDVSGNNGATDCWLLKLDSSGMIEWQTSLGGSSGDWGQSIQQMPDSGYIISGYTSSNDSDVSGHHPDGGSYNDMWAVRTDASGNILWQRCLGGSYWDYDASVILTSDGGYAITGSMSSVDGDAAGLQIHGGFDYWIAKFSSIDSLEWKQSYGGTLGDEPGGLYQTSDGGFIITGNTWSTDFDVSNPHGGRDLWIVKTDSIGNLLWEKGLGGSQGDFGLSIKETHDGGYIVTGYTASNDMDVVGQHGNEDMWVVKISNTGILQWQKPMGGSQSERGCSIFETADYDFIVAGTASSIDGDVTNRHGTTPNHDMWVVKLDSSGNMLWEKCLGGSDWEWAYSVSPTSDGQIIVAGYTQSSDGDIFNQHGSTDAWVVKLGPADPESIRENRQSPNELVTHLTDNSILISFSSPGFSKLQFTLCDMAGRILYTQAMIAIGGQNKMEIQVGDLSQGIYFVKLSGEKDELSNKVIKF